MSDTFYKLTLILLFCGSLLIIWSDYEAFVAESLERKVAHQAMYHDDCGCFAEYDKLENVVHYYGVEWRDLK
jgi:hypothetical protein